MRKVTFKHLPTGTFRQKSSTGPVVGSKVRNASVFIWNRMSTGLRLMKGQYKFSLGPQWSTVVIKEFLNFFFPIFVKN